MLALLGALKQETGELKRNMAVNDRVSGEVMPMYRGKLADKPVLLVQTGMGREKAEAAARSVIERYAPSALVSFGFCGALAEGLATGDVVLGSELCGDGQSELLGSDAGLLALCERARPPGVSLRRGKSVSTSGVVGSPIKRRALAEAWDADSVDMESYWIARVAFDKGVRFLSARAVLDTAEDWLPPFERLTSTGETARYFALHPWEPVRLVGLYRKMRRARRNLNLVLMALVANCELV